MKKTLGIVSLIALGVAGITSVMQGAEGESQVIINCNTGDISVAVSNLDFGTVNVSNSQATQFGEWKAGEGETMTGIEITDPAGMCGSSATSGNLWVVTLGLGTMTNEDAAAGSTYQLNPTTSASALFNYGGNGGSGDVRFGIDFDAADIAVTAGPEGTTDVVVPYNTYASGSQALTDVATQLVKRTVLADDMRTGAWNVTPDIYLTIPGALPAKTYLGSIDVLSQ